MARKDVRQTIDTELSLSQIFKQGFDSLIQPTHKRILVAIGLFDSGASLDAIHKVILRNGYSFYKAFSHILAFVLMTLTITFFLDSWTQR